jgi:hypothetical protein
LAQLYLGRTLRDVALAPQHSPGILTVVALTALLWHETHIPIKITTSLLIFKDVPVDRFVTDAADTLLLKRLADLLGAPLAFQQGLDLMPLVRAKL